MIARLFLCALLSCAVPAMAAPDALAVSVARVNTDSGEVYSVSASGEVAAAPDAVWRVLTDYGRMDEYVPDLKKARVLSRNGDRAIIEQFGVVRFLFFRHEIHLVVQAHEQPISQIDISLVDGDMKIYTCSWRIVPVPETGGTRITYNGTLEPKFYVPAFLGSNMIRADIKKMMAAVLARLDRPDQAG
jgi:ribosome-associated toxin RatA of RatAB toxin-antitoxin module